MRAVKLLKATKRHLFLAALLCALTVNTAAYDNYQSITGYESPTDLTVQTGGDHLWTVADGVLQSGNAGVGSTVSAIKVTVPQAGVLHFQYKVSSSYKTGDTGIPDGALTENNPDSLVICVGTEITAGTSYSGLPDGYQRFYGELGWADGSVTVDGASDVYFAYKKNGSTDSGSDCAWLRNITFTTDTAAMLTVEYDTNCGTVTKDKETYQAGDSATLTAVPNDGCQFYGWLDAAGSFLSDELTYSMTVNNNMTVRAVFAQTGTYEARRGGLFFESLSVALANARSGSTVFLLKDTELTQDAEIPSGVTLYIPYEAHYTRDYVYCDNGRSNSIADTPFRTLTVHSSVTLTVSGTLRLGAELSCTYPPSNYQGHTGGAYGAVANNGTITITAGGALDSRGIITGSGAVIADGGTVYEPFIVCDFTGGQNLEKLYRQDVTPFKRYAMQNIQCSLTVNSSSELIGRGCLYGGFQTKIFNETNIPIIASSGLFQLQAGASITRTYDADKQLTDYSGIGRENWVVTGGMSIGALQMEIMGVPISTEKCSFPLPYNLALTMLDGGYTIAHRLRILPGSTLTVGRGAELTVNGSLDALDGLKQGSMSDAVYPDSNALRAGGFSVSGELVVDGGKLVIASGAAFGGVVQNTGSGSISIAEGALLANKVQDGGVGFYSDNTSIFENFTARADLDGTLQALQPGEYRAVAATQFTLPGWPVRYVVNGSDVDKKNSAYWTDGVQYATETVAAGEIMYGAWTSGTQTPSEHSVTVVNKTYYDANDSSCTSVKHELNGDMLTFTVTTLKSAYTHLVQVRTGDGEAVTVKPDEKGTYTVTGVSDNVTILVTSVLKGDVIMDGKINNKDLIRVRQIVLSNYMPTELERLTADTFSDGKINNKDLIRVRQYILGNIQAF